MWSLTLMPSWSLDASTLTGLPSDDFLPSTSTVVEIFGLWFSGTLAVDDAEVLDSDAEVLDDGFSLDVDELVDVTREDDVVEDSEPDEVGTTGFGAEVLAEVEDVADDEEEELEDGVSLSHLTLMPAVAFEGTSSPGYVVTSHWKPLLLGLRSVPAGSLDVFVVDAEIFA